ncbi:hypothetical protein [Corynebacterium sp. H113]|uniref:hypothetical protein n=1 Tax=Corynebacterium sp. H113 TaxID=3133419 RepID=UPI0030B0E99C
MCIITWLSDGQKSYIGPLFLALAAAGPAIWWFRCERKDKESQKAHTEAEAYYGLLTDEDRSLLAPLNDAPKAQRKWKIVTPLAILAFFIGGMLLPPPKNQPVPPQQNAVAPIPSTTESEAETRTETSTTSKSSKTVSTVESTEDTASEEQNEPEANSPVDTPEQVPELEPTTTTATVQEEYQPAPAPVPDPDPVPAPAPEPSGGGLKCADIGHKTYIGDGVYVPDHDADGDGVGCESYPG